MYEINDYTDESGRVDVTANTPYGLVTIQESRSDTNDPVLEIVVVDDSRTKWESLRITPDQFGRLPIATEEVSDER